MKRAEVTRIIQDRIPIEGNGVYLLVLPEGGGYELIALTEEERELVLTARRRRLAPKTPS